MITSAESNNFSVMTLGLEELTFKRTADKTPAHEKVDYQKVDLAEFAGQLPKRLAKQKIFDRFYDRSKVSPALELLVLARACVANGLADFLTRNA